MSSCRFPDGRALRARLGWSAALTATLVLLPGRTAGAQTLMGRVMEEGTSSPVEAVLVELLAQDSTRVGVALTGDDGRYALIDVGPGAYLIRLNRLGYRTTLLGPFELRTDSIVNLPLAPDPIALEPIQATGSRRCSVRPDEGEQTARLWEQIYKALAVTDVVRREGLLQFEQVGFLRELDLDRTVQRREELRAVVAWDPFLGMEGRALASNGFVQPIDAKELMWYMPDANVILSNAFLDTHCFSVVERRDAGRRLLGLAFEPYDEVDRDDPEFPVSNPGFVELIEDRGADVAGVLWVDAASGALETLEYVYKGIRDARLRDIGGGHARYEQLADGKWIVRQWWIRTPIVAERPQRGAGRPRFTATGVREDGGELMEVRSPDGTRATRRAGFPVTGRLVPSDLGIPLDSPTVVRFSGTAWLTSVAPDSTFRFPDIPPGSYLATFYHPRLDTLAMDLPVVSVTVSRGPAHVELRVPDRATVLDQVCGDVDHDSGNGVLFAPVTLADGTPVAGQEVWLRSVRAHETIGKATTNEEGRARFCDVPVSTPLEGSLPGRLGIRAEVTLAPGGFARRDLRLPDAGG